MNGKLLLAVIVSEGISLFLIWRTWKTEDPKVLKILQSLGLLVPIFGPLFYVFATKAPKNMPAHLRDKPRDTDYVDRGWRANYDDKWRAEKPALKRKIRDLEKELNK